MGEWAERVVVEMGRRGIGRLPVERRALDMSLRVL
jgi:hypothetical protein